MNEKDSRHIERYSRQVMLPEIGGEGQRRLSAASVAVVGAGGLGSPVLYCLASAGVGHIRIIDSDTVDITNLNRQFVHSQDDIGRQKAQSAMEALARYNHDIEICADAVALDADNAEELLAGHDLVLSCVDNKKTRHILNGVCVRGGVPLIDGGIRGFEGYVLIVLPGVTPCYQCIFPQKDQQEADAGIGVLGATAGVLGSLMATEAIKRIVGIPAQACFYFVDLLSSRITTIQAKKDPGCPVCAPERTAKNLAPWPRRGFI